MPKIEVRCSNCKTCIGETSPKCGMCERRHFFCINCVQENERNCPICNNPLIWFIFSPEDAVESTTESIAESHISSAPLEQNNSENVEQNKDHVEPTEFLEIRVRASNKLAQTLKIKAKQLKGAVQPSVETKDATQQTVDEGEESEEHFSAAQNKKLLNKSEQTSYSKPIYSSQLCRMDEQTTQGNLLELHNYKDNANKRDEIKVRRSNKLAEALQETCGTLERKFENSERTRVPRPETSLASKSPERNCLEELEKTHVKTYLYCCRPLITEELKSNEPNMTPIYASKSEYKPPSKTYISDAIAQDLSMEVSTFPIFCPNAYCGELLAIMQIAPHFACDHDNVPLENIKLEQLKSFSFHAHYVFKKDKRQTVMLYMLQDSALQLHSKNPHSSYIPIFVLAKRTNAAELFAEADRKLRKLEYLVVWLEAILPEQIDIQGNLLLVGDADKECGHRMVSSSVCSLRQRQDVRSIYEKGKAMLLERALVKKITDNGKEPLKMQVILK